MIPFRQLRLYPGTGTYNVIKRFQPPSCFPSPVLKASNAKSSIFIKAGARTSTTCSLLSAVGGKGRLEALGNGWTIWRYGKFGTILGSSYHQVPPPPSYWNGHTLFLEGQSPYPFFNRCSISYIDKLEMTPCLTCTSSWTSIIEPK